MKRSISLLVVLVGLTACEKQSSNVNEMTAIPLVVGTQTSFYEAVSPNELKLAQGVRVEPVNGSTGPNGAFVLMKQNESGGYIACGCVGAQTSTCKTDNDNPDHWACSGGCTDSEGNAHGCTIETLPGPPKDPYFIRFVTATAVEPPVANPTQ